jgi:small subunit ribosomal protein S16
LILDGIATLALSLRSKKSLSSLLQFVQSVNNKTNTASFVSRIELPKLKEYITFFDNFNDIMSNYVIHYVIFAALFKTKVVCYIKGAWFDFINQIYNKKMAVKLRLARRGRKKQPFYHIIAADSRSPRDGKFIEKLGTYNPLTVPATIEIDRERAFDWLMKGAQPTDTVNAILRFKGVNYQKHLAIGVNKGKLTQEEADAKLNAWLEAKSEKTESRIKKTSDDKQAYWKAVSGEAKAAKVTAAPPEEREAFHIAEEAVTKTEEVETAIEETSVADAPVVAEAPTVEEAVVADEAPAAEESTQPEETTEA